MATHLKRSLLLHRELHRLSLSAVKGPVFTWDVDNTYLITPLDGIRAMLGVAVEFAVDKRPVPGAVWLLKALRRGPDGERRPIFFISASPEQLRPILRRRMLLDGVEYDGLTLRNWTGLLGTGRLRPLKRAFAYKVAALLENRLLMPACRTEYLFGDDLEQDLEVYDFYARVLRGDIDRDGAERALRPHVTFRRDTRLVGELVEALQRDRQTTPRVTAVIRCVRRPDAAAMSVDTSVGPLDVVRAADMFAAALFLSKRSIIDLQAVHRVALDMVHRGAPQDLLQERLDEARSAAWLDDDSYEALAGFLEDSLGRPMSR